MSRRGWARSLRDALGFGGTPEWWPPEPQPEPTRRESIEGALIFAVAVAVLFVYIVATA